LYGAPKPAVGGGGVVVRHACNSVTTTNELATRRHPIG
jgi:hypothetical protein